MCAQRYRRIVLQFVMISVIRLRSRVAASAIESADYIQRWGVANRRLVAVITVVLKAELIDGFGSENLRIADLDGMFRGVVVIARGSERKPSDTGVVLRVF